MKIVYAEKQSEIFAVVNIRKSVFVIEQNVSIEEELDELDYDARHFLIVSNDEYVGTARIVYNDDHVSIGRVAVLKEHRKHGYGAKLIQHLIDDIRNDGHKRILIGAQVQALPFYEKLGFEQYGDIYLDANIEHYHMELKLWIYRLIMWNKSFILIGHWQL